MQLQPLSWQVGHTSDPAQRPLEWYPAQVPGAAQMDYARAKNWPPVEFGTNYRAFDGLEDLYWCYEAPLSFALEPWQGATLVFLGIDYRYRISVDDRVLADGEGMFTPVKVDVTEFAGGEHNVQVLVYPAPKADDSGTRDQARKCCKPAACYGWDWHPRIITSGLYDQAGLWIHHKTHIRDLQVSYRLTEDLSRADITVEAGTLAVARLLDGDRVVAEATGSGRLTLTVDQPKLWYPIGYGPQFRYELAVSALEDGREVDKHIRPLGLRRSRMVMNTGSWKMPNLFPKSRSDAPATLEINGQRVFAKGSNWVNIHLYPGAATYEDYKNLLQQVRYANMNILRIWGGGFVNHEAFFALCDEYGIMVWQEFPLACNEYPDEDPYLAVLEQEAVSIVRRLRTHPCLVLWCGGNELFNHWSKMTDQHHALRVLDQVCYKEDRFTPFIKTSPLMGMAHGPYVNYDNRLNTEYLPVFIDSHNTAYTEFGAPGAASADYIRKYCTEEDLKAFPQKNAAFKEHFGVDAAFFPDTWLRTSEADYYFGGWKDLEDLCEKTQFIQAICYRALFEEMRRQWPHCSMALNWCFNEPWPCFGNNSLVSWPCEPKPALETVRQALRPSLASLRARRHRYTGGETFCGEIWMLNDSPDTLENLTVQVSYRIGDGPERLWGALRLDSLPARENARLGSISFPLPQDSPCRFEVYLRVPEHGDEMNSHYTFFCYPARTVKKKGQLNE